MSTIFEALNQYSVIMELAPQYLTDLSSLNRIYISTAGQSASGTEISNAAAGTVTAPGASTGVGRPDLGARGGHQCDRDCKGGQRVGRGCG